MWQHWRPSLRLESGSVHVIVWPLAASDDDPEQAAEQPAWLSPDERSRAERFVFERHRVAFKQAHVGMRRILGAYLGRPPGSLTFQAGAHGKPELSAPHRRVHFNLSHTRGLCALAVCTPPDETGVDVERVRPIEARVAERYFSRSEQAQLAGLTADAWTEAFFRCWTRKEALLKAEGFGLHAPLDSFDVSLLPGEPAALLARRPEAGFRRSWTLYHFEPEAGVTGAVAISSEAEPVLLRMHSLPT